MSVARNNPNYGRGVVEVGSIDLVDEQQLKLRLLEVFRAPNYQPPTLPAVALDVLRLSQQPNVSFNDVSKVLERDGMMTGQVLKLAQSPLFAGKQRVTSIQQAMVRLGLRTVRDAVVQVALNAKVFRSKGYAPAMDSLRCHSTAVGHLSRIVSRYTSFDGEFAFLCGLLHDVGVAGCLIALAEHAKPNPPPPVVEVWPAIMAVHEEASALMAKNWGLPEDVAMVLGAHHRILIQGYPHPLAATVGLADEMSATMGCGLSMVAPEASDASDESRLEPVRRQELVQALSLSDAQLALIEKDGDALREHLERM